MGLFGILVIIFATPILVLFFKWFWRNFPWSEKNPLKLWMIIMLFVLLLAFLV